MKLDLDAIEYQSSGRGRAPSKKSISVRRAVIKTIWMSDTALTTKEIAKATKKSKADVIAALRWAEQHGHINFAGWQKHDGVGHPMAVWMV